MEMGNVIRAIKEATTENLMEAREDIQKHIEIQAGFAMTESEFFHQPTLANNCVRLALINKELSERK